jgi:RHS repeat-associated protein
VQTTEGSTIRTMVYDIFGQNVADYLGSSGATLERENIYRGGQLLATNESLSAGAPSALAATPSSSNIALSWSGSASKYRVEHKGAGGSYELLTTTTSTSTTDSGASTGNAYLYRVCAADGANNCTSDYSNIALGARLNFTTDATIVSYSDDPSTATSIKAAHITELRTAINAVRSLEGQSSASWTHTTLTAQSSLIYADDVRDLRSALNDALVALSIQTSNYTDNTIVSYAENPLTATTVKAAHIRELRTRSTSGAGNSTSGGSSGGLHYVLSDLQGSTRAVMNNNGSSSAVIARHDYLPFGEEIGSGIGLRTSSQGYAASDTNRWKYGMLQRDAATGLDHTWFRKYESISGRWTSPDPLHGSIADPQSFNGYNYTGNDPVNFVDPSGLAEYGPKFPSTPPTQPPPHFLGDPPMTFYVTVPYPVSDPLDLGRMHDPLRSADEEVAVGVNQRPKKTPTLVKVVPKIPRNWKKEYEDCLAKAEAAYHADTKDADEARDATIHEYFPEALDPSTKFDRKNAPVLLLAVVWLTEAQREGAYERAASKRDRARQAC